MPPEQENRREVVGPHQRISYPRLRIAAVAAGGQTAKHLNCQLGRIRRGPQRLEPGSEERGELSWVYQFRHPDISGSLALKQSRGEQQRGSVPVRGTEERIGSGVAPGQVGTTDLHRKLYRVFVGRGESGIQGDRPVKGVEDLSRCDQRLAKVIPRLADTLPYLGVPRISACRGVERREESAVHGEKRRVLVIQRQFERVGKKEQTVPRVETLVQGGRLQTVRVCRLEALPGRRGPSQHT